MQQRKELSLALCGIMSALAVVMALILHFPIFPAVPFLEYDAADIPLFLLSALCGPWYGIAGTVIASVIQGITVSSGSGWIGILMHIFSTSSFILVQSAVLSHFHFRTVTLPSFPRMVCATLAGVCAMVGAMAIWNLFFTPIYMKIPRALLVRNFYGWILLFNLVKAGINGALSVVLFGALRPFLQGRKIF